MSDPLRVRLSGPLREFGPGFVDELERRVLAAGRDAADASDGSREQSDASRGSGVRAAERRRRGACPGGASRGGSPDYVTARAVAPLLAYLRKLGAVPSSPPCRRQREQRCSAGAFAAI